MWRFEILDDEGFRVFYPDGSKTTMTLQELGTHAARYIDHGMTLDWPQEAQAAVVENPLACAFHDIYCLMTPEGMKGYEALPDAMKWSQANPYIWGCLATIGAAKCIHLLDAASPKLWSGEIDPAKAFELTDGWFRGGLNAIWELLKEARYRGAEAAGASAAS